MGCCSIRMQDPVLTKRSKIQSFINDYKLNSLKCSDIKAISGEDFNSITYNKQCKISKINVPFEVIATRNIILNFELKTALLLFSDDGSENKLEIFNLIVTNDRLLVRFLEWRYQLINERLPKQLHKANYIDYDEHKDLTENQRLTAAYEIIKSFEVFKSNNSITMAQLLSIS
jgi:hypothetical protein